MKRCSSCLEETDWVDEVSELCMACMHELEENE
ncbi:hypothetical protein ICY_05185 [Bacillus cereus BAG2X1-3]|nr:hypothetical protein ICU_05013 [Bacillus cereus BAG2X1-1]EJS64327.1 hypothetical protein ICY_05185 [Bacillus cereus BAG2X1-3]EJS68074.1 hypothetical protein ICU_02671 [Bacillus cereus BAG2X1-1]